MHEPPQGGSVTTRASSSADPIRIGILRTAFCVVALRRVPAPNPRREATRQEDAGGPCINASCIFAAGRNIFPAPHVILYRGTTMKYATSIRPAAALLFCAAVAAVTFAHAAARAQNSANKPSSASDAPPGQGAAGADMSDMQHESEQNPEAAKAANDAMDMSDMDMSANPHMFMTELQPKQPGDDRRAEEIVEILGKSISKYKDYKVALADDYKIFFPNVKQPIYHFTNYKNAIAASFIFNPAHPTSLLYKKTADGHELVNFCLPPRGAAPTQTDWKKFGLAGSIATEDACARANGRWIRQVFGWMVHVYPFQTE